MELSADAKAVTIARSRALIEDVSNWPAGFLRVQLHPWLVDGNESADGIIRAFDPTSVLLPGRKMQSFRSVREVAEVWGPALTV